MPPKHGLDDETVDPSRYWEDYRSRRIAIGIEPAAVDQEIAKLGCHTTANSSSSDLKQARVSKPFNEKTWEDAVEHFHLAPFTSVNPMQAFPDSSPCPLSILPKEVHRRLQDAGWRSLDVYGDVWEQEGEATTVRLLEPWIVVLSSLFYGRLLNTPENDIEGYGDCSGGKVEYEMRGPTGTWMLVIEVKGRISGQKSLAKYMAQAFYEAEAIWHLNSRNGLRQKVFALLTDVTQFYLFSYDGKTLERYERFATNWADRRHFLRSMLLVSHKLFGILVQSFIWSLEAHESRSKLSLPLFAASLPLPVVGHKTAPHLTRKGSRPSLERWEQALELAREAQTLLANTFGSAEEIDQRATDGLRLITDSLKWIPRKTATDDLMSQSEISEASGMRIDDFFARGCTFEASMGAG